MFPAKELATETLAAKKALPGGIAFLSEASCSLSSGRPISLPQPSVAADPPLGRRSIGFDPFYFLSIFGGRLFRFCPEHVGAPGRDRTADLILTMDALYRLSYRSQ